MKCWPHRTTALVAAGLTVVLMTMASVCAFSNRDMILVNIAWPMVRAGLTAHQNDRPILRAMLQAAAGGFMMKEAMKLASLTNENTPGKVWQAKLLMNTGASLCESAGEEAFRFRMDLGPIWMIADRNSIRFRPGIHGTIAPLLNLSDGAYLDLGRSIRFGTTTFQRSRRYDGTISKSGALAYSNANNIITNREGSHLGHELLHTFQYRRDAFLITPITSIFPRLANEFHQVWVDDTGWGVNWATQKAWAAANGKNSDFDIYMEREAYYLADHYNIHE